MRTRPSFKGVPYGNGKATASNGDAKDMTAKGNGMVYVNGKATAANGNGKNVNGNGKMRDVMPSVGEWCRLEDWRAIDMESVSCAGKDLCNYPLDSSGGSDAPHAKEMEYRDHDEDSRGSTHIGDNTDGVLLELTQARIADFVQESSNKMGRTLITETGRHICMHDSRVGVHHQRFAFDWLEHAAMYPPPEPHKFPTAVGWNRAHGAFEDAVERERETHPWIRQHMRRGGQSRTVPRDEVDAGEHSFCMCSSVRVCACVRVHVFV